MRQMISDSPIPAKGRPENNYVIKLAIDALDDELDTLGADTIRRLGQSRKQALKSSRRSAWFNTLQKRSNLVSACASVATVLLMLALFMPADNGQTHDQDVRVESNKLPDGLNHEDVDFYGSIDFLLWLEQQRVTLTGFYYTGFYHAGSYHAGFYHNG